VRLLVYHNRIQVGAVQSVEGGLEFHYSAEYLATPNRHPVSLALPLQEAPLPIRATERFFEGLLPEGEERAKAARYLRVSSQSVTKLLAAMAGDCVGNLTILAPDDDLDSLLAASSYEPLSPGDFQDILNNDLDAITRISAENRLSIPGAQPKIGLYCAVDPLANNGEGWYVPRGLYASTHIIKPNLLAFDNTSLNEYFGSQLARRAGLETPRTWIANNNGNAVLISERFDRYENEDGFIERLCQEDFCQALSYSPNNKYQADGGPGFAQILDILRFEMTNPPADVQRFLQLFIFNYLIGNCDAHARNYSIQRTSDGLLRLAPAYDLVSTTFYPKLSTNVAMGVNNTYALAKIDTDDFKTMCEDNRIAWELFERIAASLVEGIIGGVDAIEEELREAGFGAKAHKLKEHFATEVEVRQHVLL